MDSEEPFPQTIDPDDLPDDPAALKELVVELYETLAATTELVEASTDDDEATDLGWLTQHLAEETPGEAGSGDVHHNG